MGTLDILLILFFVYLLLPVKHPCDYGSYKQWWNDIDNWLGG